MTARLPMEGLKFNRLTVIRLAGRRKTGLFYAVRCECGSELEVRAQSLRNGHTKSCGCLRAEYGAAMVNCQPPSLRTEGPLTQERLHEVLLYDEITGEWRWKVQAARRRKAGDRAGSINAAGYRQIKIGGEVYLAHRLAWLYVHGMWPDTEIDHRDLNKSNCAFANLREASRAENMQNTERRSNNEVGYKGVSRKRGKYVAEIKQNGKRTRLGLFDTPEEARDAYNFAALNLHGEFHRKS